MQCVRCGRDFPSEYHFKPGRVCAECDAGLTPEERLRMVQPSRLRRMTSTTFDLPGYQVVEVLGVVRGITVRSRSIFGTIGGALQTVVGGNISLFTDLCASRLAATPSTCCWSTRPRWERTRCSAFATTRRK